MVGVLWLLGIAVIVVAAALGLAALPGRVSAEIGTFTIDLPTSLAVLTIVLLAVLLHLLIGLIRIPGRLAGLSLHRRRRQGDEAVTASLVALAAAEPGIARRQAARARKFLGDTPQTLLLAAEAGRLAGREEEATLALRALAARPQGAFLGFRGLLRQAIAREDWPEATELARKAEAANPGVSWLADERARVAIRGADWPEAMRLAKTSAARAALAVAASRTESDADRALTLARNAFEADPGLAPAAIAFAGQMRRIGREGRAQTVLAESWAIRPHPDVASFALAGAATPLDGVNHARTLAAANPTDPESFLLLARASLDAGLSGEARRHALLARDAGVNSRRVLPLLAAIEEKEDPNSEAARDYLREAATADPDPVWRCMECHADSVEWHPACPSCHTPGSLRWGNTTALTLARPGIMRRLLPWR